MALSDPAFLLLFLPAALAGSWVLKGRPRAAVWWLLAASLAFHLMAGWRAGAILAVTILLNYALARAIHVRAGKGTGVLLALGCLLNLGAMTAFKAGPGVAAWGIPLGFSYAALQQVAYLVDVWRGEHKPAGLAAYMTWVLFFPKAIAGPILDAGELLPELARPDRPRPDFHRGLLLILCGLAKKILLADPLARVADRIFLSPATPDFFAGWTATASFAMRLYFDFSGYCDIAMGVALLFGFRLPFNFHAPYRAASVVEFWRRWHITLTRFLTRYVFYALPGTRRLRPMRYVNTVLTMALCGLWHGLTAGFLVWGLLHGLMLALNHWWRERGIRLGLHAGRALTWIGVCFAWAFFAAPSLDRAWAIVRGMAGLGGFLMGRDRIPLLLGGTPLLALPLLAASVIACVWGPTVQEFLNLEWRYTALDSSGRRWQLTLAHGVLIGLLLAAVAGAYLSAPPAKFIYGGF